MPGLGAHPPSPGCLLDRRRSRLTVQLGYRCPGTLRVLAGMRRRAVAMAVALPPLLVATGFADLHLNDLYGDMEDLDSVEQAVGLGRTGSSLVKAIARERDLAIDPRAGSAEKSPGNGRAATDAEAALFREALERAPEGTAMEGIRTSTREPLNRLVSIRMLAASGGAPADVEAGSFSNNGEACVALTRVLAPRNRYEEIVAALAALADSLVVGDPADPKTFIGPMVREGQRDLVQAYIASGIDTGARLVAGGPGAPRGLENGYYVRPTVFADVDNSMRIAQEEIFEPVIVVIPYDDESDAIRIANDAPYGLSGAVFTADPVHGVEVARAVRTGVFSVNGAPRHWEAPFGGYKNSDFGREYGRHGLDEYTELKAIATALTV